jgi:hypothetical protein
MKIDRKWINDKGKDITLIDNIIISEFPEASDLKDKEGDKLIRCLLAALVF